MWWYGYCIYVKSLCNGRGGRGFIMDATSNDQILLTEYEAALLLQPHMQNKSALDWLVNDRQNDSVLPYLVSQGKHCYRESDVVFFILHALNPSARFVRVHNHLVTQSRKLSDRRWQGGCRRKEAIQLRPGIERRRSEHPDRRLSGDPDRRAQAATYY